MSTSDFYTHFLSLLPQRVQFKVNQGSWIHLWRLLILLYCAFILEGTIKRTKMLASKGNDDRSMWQKVTRGLGKIISITKIINVTLKIHVEDGERSISIDKDISNWRALLQKSKYLNSHRNTEFIFNIHGKRLSNDLINFSSNLK